MSAPSPERLLYEGLRSALETGLVGDAVIAASEAQAEGFWRLRDRSPRPRRRTAPPPSTTFRSPVEAMAGFMIEAAARGRGALPRHAGRSPSAISATATSISTSARPPARDAAWLEDEGEAVTAFVHDLVTAAGGSISAEHGIGQAKLDELARLADPARLNAMRAIKRALDPQEHHESRQAGSASRPCRARPLTCAAPEPLRRKRFAHRGLR